MENVISLNHLMSTTIPIGRLKLLSHNIVSINGNIVNLGPGAFKDLLSELNVNKQFLGSVNKISDIEDADINMLNKIINSSKQRGTTLKLIYNEADNTITRLTNVNKITNLTPNLVNDLIGNITQDENISLRNVYITDDGTKI